ncbi:50S ribosomal protein L6 [Kingella negevensis]|uniref:Large ribosomal subunit protein uL6 n=1 Tax=Kingella negevensis TaxID=1522312 RepID=A0A238TGY0_9NEIS|nr:MULTISPECIES: 50S ribosomal protein L6 [Kingella]MDK4574972.1 50S ribosomal protein L6 [Kingella kingae]MDK4606668.1 50S ribosomal protein L6 [Kingella kingae]MDK4679486.1 50S ribosomal protein L6 [Kingella negevensis]MDK4682796.1 50S ribosomal protein L6 [Kingella negevensis]MDK4684936.1 50S ribosomal protein L6 [Kingella negevensis]
MSRVAKNPVTVPAGVEVNFGTDALTVKGKNGALSLPLTGAVKVELNDGQLTFAPADESKHANAMSGTVRALVANMVKGVSEGFEKKLQLIGVGYRAQAQGKTLNLSLGFSHPVVYEMPEGVSVVTPSQTEIILTGADKQAVGQAAAEIRGYRPPEPYKGKGVRYVGENVIMKEAKKK